MKGLALHLTLNNHSVNNDDVFILTLGRNSLIRFVFLPPWEHACSTSKEILWIEKGKKPGRPEKTWEEGDMRALKKKENKIASKDTDLKWEIVTQKGNWFS